MAYRVTLRGQRCEGTKHNFREFDTSNVDHIHDDKTCDNIYIDLTADEFLPIPDGFKVPEAQIISRVYDDLYSDGLEALNQRYIDSRHKERCRTMDELMKGKQTRPTEQILQIGNRDDIPVPADTLIQAIQTYTERVRDYCISNGIKHKFLSCAIHFDETTPHVHLKETFYAATEGGFMPRQEECFRQAGISLPHPEQPESKYNNRKITFDATRREMLQEICRELGLDIITEPRPNRRHKSKADYVAECQDKRQAMLDASQQDLQRYQLNLGNGESVSFMALTTALKKLPEVNEEFINQYRVAFKELEAYGLQTLEQLKDAGERDNVMPDIVEPTIEDQYNSTEDEDWDDKR